MTKTLIIAEAGVNHNGSIDVACALIDAAADAGADVVKFQSFSADALATSEAKRAEYQIVNMGEGGSQQEMLRALELSPSDHAILHQHCLERGVAFLSTAFDFASLDIILEFDPAWIKIPSGDVVFGAMLLRAARTGKHIILSTGMATLSEIEDALAVIAFGLTRNSEPTSLAEAQKLLLTRDAQRALSENVTILHCVSMYPCPPNAVNLAAMDSIRDRFGLPVGYSDHSLGIAIPVAAVARGATIIEKHLTLDRQMPGPDHAASLQPTEFADMVLGIREVEQAIGNGLKQPTHDEMQTRLVARRSLVAARAVAKGETMRLADLEAKRPGTGLSPMKLWDMVGSVADQDYAVDELIREC
jgi:N-acetylneuraminate synthase